MIEKGDIERAGRLAHTVKGAGGNLAADNIHAAAKDVESAISKIIGRAGRFQIQETQEDV
ncbi:Signal transduction histidine kinase, phosphotransfer (Hpt) region domain protein, partial [Candidatus Magnetoovum chiemensis]